MFGGARKMRSASGARLRTCSAPWTSIFKTMSLPAPRASSRGAIGVPYRPPSYVACSTVAPPRGGEVGAEHRVGRIPFHQRPELVETGGGGDLEGHLDMGAGGAKAQAPAVQQGPCRFAWRAAAVLGIARQRVTKRGEMN